jgi:hypothetical protein
MNIRKTCSALLLLASLSVVAVGATMYLQVEWTIGLTAATPNVRFIKWSDLTLSNTIDLAYNLYADIWLQVSNDTTYGIKNTDAGDAHTVYLDIESISDEAKVYNVTVWIMSKDGVTEKAEMTWQGGSLPTAEQNFSAVANTEYIIKTWVKGASTVGAVTVTLKLKQSP